jgi:hypothetical protein
MTTSEENLLKKVSRIVLEAQRIHFLVVRKGATALQHSFSFENW